MHSPWLRFIIILAIALASACSKPPAKPKPIPSQQTPEGLCEAIILTATNKDQAALKSLIIKGENSDEWIDLATKQIIKIFSENDPALGRSAKLAGYVVLSFDQYFDTWSHNPSVVADLKKLRAKHEKNLPVVARFTFNLGANSREHYHYYIGKYEDKFYIFLE